MERNFGTLITTCTACGKPLFAGNGLLACGVGIIGGDNPGFFHVGCAPILPEADREDIYRTCSGCWKQLDIREAHIARRQDHERFHFGCEPSEVTIRIQRDGEWK